MSANGRYDSVAMTLHWVTAAAIAVQFLLGWTMTSLPRGSAVKFAAVQSHKSLGITILALSLIRLGWRLLHRTPPLPASMPEWQKRLAHLNHAALYAMLILLPLTGWAVVSASPRNVPSVVFGVLPLPPLPVLSTLSDKKAAEEILESVHEAGGWILLALLAGHVAAALRHRFLLRDGILDRMLPRFGS